jgi:hypothetical protein
MIPSLLELLCFNFIVGDLEDNSFLAFLSEEIKGKKEIRYNNHI